MRSPDARTLVALLLMTSAVGACGSSGRVVPHAAEADSLLAGLPADAPDPGALRVRLAFGAASDLDLFVTDPAQESVYFANSPSRSGGALAQDVRCSDEGSRVETVVFPDARAGRYRVGVDYPRGCDGYEGEAAFVVVVDGAGVAKTRRGRITPGIFQPIVIEVDVVATPPD